MIMKTKLKKASMSFETKNGDILLISNEDINEIATKIILESMLNPKSDYFILEEEKIKKCDLLYKIVIEQEKTLSKKIKMDYLKTILKLITPEEKGF